MKPCHPLRRAAVPACAFVLLTASAAAFAQTAIVVTGARAPIAVDRVAGDLVVIDRDRLQASSADSIEDLLRREAGLQLSRSGGPGANAGLLIRGANAAHTLVLVDGVRIGTATSGLPELEALSLAGIERIEVLRGPGSSLYGADAVGGVVHIVTRPAPPDGVRVGARAAAGGAGAREGHLHAAAAVNRFDLAATVAGEHADGVSALRPGDLFGNHHPDRDGYTRRSANLRAGWAPAAGHRVALHALGSRLDARYDGSEFAPPDFVQDNSADFRNRLTLHTVSLQHEATWSERWSTLLRIADGRSSLASGGRLIDRFATERTQAEVQATWRPVAGHTLTIVLDRLREAALSTAYAADVERDNEALALAWAGRVAALDLQADVRHDRNSVHGGVSTGRLGAAWSPAGGWRLRMLAGTTFHAPTFNDLYFPGYGVPTIRPERGRSIEAGIAWRGGPHDAALTVYRNRVTDLIAFESDRTACPPGFAYDFGCARNIGRARLQGATLAGGTRAGAWTVRGSVDVLDAIDTRSGARLPRRAAHQATLSVGWRDGPWSAGAEVVRLGARPDGGKTLAAETTVDLQLRWRAGPAWQLEARLLNATDRDREPARDYQGLGRQAWVGVRYEGQGL